MALCALSMTGGKNGGRHSRPLQLASDTIARHVIEEIGPRWGLSRATADAALGELRDDGLVDWPTPAPIMSDDGNAVVGREVREVFLTSGAWTIARHALGMLNPEISGVTSSSDPAPPVTGGASAGERRGTTIAAAPPGSLDGFLAFASRNVEPF